VAFINTSVDHDTAVNCETVNAGWIKRTDNPNFYFYFYFLFY
jgi:hypothetical protein